MNYGRTRFSLDRAGVVWLSLAALVFAASAVVERTKRRTESSSEAAIRRQVLDVAARRQATPTK